ncbi:hypothetical protein [Halorubrum aethiopicum]|uniref:hypothetical protein n=1 Tax=Halorubrum aethiopicum TaxID=1758255 RepID=UPI000835A091|nr:hypothetical protein [Halorubrum aethiopicum]
MSVTGLCQICENAPARHACRYCGRQVCRDHWNETVGACTPCAEASGVGDGGGGRGGRSDDDTDGGDDGFRID